MKAYGMTLILGVVVACGSTSKQEQSALQESCEALVAAESVTRPSGVETVSIDADSAGTSLTVSVAGSTTLWRCRADASGAIVSVEAIQGV
jgi:hypothetical protein